jgi:hypothetical protein
MLTIEQDVPLHTGKSERPSVTIETPPIDLIATSDALDRPRCAEPALTGEGDLVQPQADPMQPVFCYALYRQLLKPL